MNFLIKNQTNFHGIGENERDMHDGAMMSVRQIIQQQHKLNPIHFIQKMNNIFEGEMKSNYTQEIMKEVRVQTLNLLE